MRTPHADLDLLGNRLGQFCRVEQQQTGRRAMIYDPRDMRPAGLL